MKGRKHLKVFTVIGGAFIVLALIGVLMVAIATEKKHKLREIDMADGRTELTDDENYRKSFLEGAAFGNLNYEVASSDFPEAKRKRFRELSDSMNEDFTLDSQRRVYEYAAQILEKDIDFYYHDSQDKTAYMEGYMATTTFFLSETFSANGFINKNSADEIREVYIELLADPSEDLFKIFLKKATEEMQPPSV